MLPPVSPGGKPSPTKLTFTRYYDNFGPPTPFAASSSQKPRPSTRETPRSPTKPTATTSKVATAFGIRHKRSRQELSAAFNSPRAAKRLPSTAGAHDTTVVIDQGTDHTGVTTIIRRPLRERERNTPTADRTTFNTRRKDADRTLVPKTPVSPTRPNISRPYPLGYPASPAPPKVDWLSPTKKAFAQSRVLTPKNTVFSPNSSRVRLTPARLNFLDRPMAYTPSSHSPSTIKTRRGSSYSYESEAEHPIPGHFSVVEEISKQGMSGATLAVYHQLEEGEEGKIVCFKSFNKQRLRQEPGLQDVFLNEIKAFKRLGVGKSNGFVMQALGSLQSATSVFIAMPIMTCDLRTIIDGHKEILPTHSRRWLAQMVTGIGFLHERGIIHRDFKPENLLLDARLNVRLVDFGLSYVTESDHRVTAEMEIYGFVGTKEYAAPEMWAEPYVHGREIDYWALGCVAYELLSQSHSVLFSNTELRRREFYAYGGKVLPFTITDLSVDAHAFISTLLRMLPSERRGHRELKHHTFFVSETDWDVTEFIDIERRALERSESFSHKHRPPRGLKKLIRPIPDVPEEALGELFAGVELTWINPISSWRVFR